MFFFQKKDNVYINLNPIFCDNREIKVGKNSLKKIVLLCRTRPAVWFLHDNLNLDLNSQAYADGASRRFSQGGRGGVFASLSKQKSADGVFHLWYLMHHSKKAVNVYAFELSVHNWTKNCINSKISIYLFITFKCQIFIHLVCHDS